MNNALSPVVRLVHICTDLPIIYILMYHFLGKSFQTSVKLIKDDDNPCVKLIKDDDKPCVKLIKDDGKPCVKLIQDD